MSEVTSSPVAIVTGAGSGIGRAVASELDRRGYAVVVADKDLPRAKESARELRAALTVRVDVGDGRDVDRAVAETIEWAGQIDLLVNSAGVGSQQTVVDTPPELWEHVFAVNVRGTYNCCRAVLPLMIERQSGVIINIASVAGLVGLADRAAYCASKGAVISLTKAMAIDHVQQGIRINCVCPGTVDTPWVTGLLAASGDPAATRAALIARQPMGRLGRPEEVAEAVAYLASDAAAFITGTALVIDGGFLAGRSATQPTESPGE